MTPREERGLVISALCKLTKKGGQWFVPSQSSQDKKYIVDHDHETCTCPDHQETGFVCKHVFAVKFTMKRELNADGTVTETKSITFAEKKVYRQNWQAYNLAQTTEKHRFKTLLRDLCQGVSEPGTAKTARPLLPLSHRLFT